MLQIFQTNALGVAVPQMGIAKIEIKKLTNRAGVKSNGQITHYAPIKDVLAGKKAVSEADQADMPNLEFDKDGFVKPDNVKQIQQIHKENARLKQKNRKLAKERDWNWQYQAHMNGEPTFTYLHTWKELVKKASFYGGLEKQYKKLKREYGADFDDHVKYMKENGGQKAGFSDLGDIELYEQFKADHKQAIAEALKRGVDVPKAVLKEYPEFATIKPKQEPKVKADTSTTKPIDSTNATYTKLVGGTGGTIEFPDKNSVSLIIGTDGRTPKGDDIYSTFVSVNNGDIVAKIPANQYARDLYTKATITSLAESAKNVKTKEELQTLLTKFDDGLIQKQRDKYGKISGKVVDYVDATKGIVEAEIPLSPYKLVPLNQVPRKTIQGKQYGDFITHKEGNDYQITHIPSGLKITTGDKAIIDKQAQSLANSEVAKFIPKNLGRIMFGLDLSGYAITPSEFNAAMRKALKV